MGKVASDRVKFLEAFDIDVGPEIKGDNIMLTRNGITIPYNMMFFFNTKIDVLKMDILRRFRERYLDDQSTPSPKSTTTQTRNIDKVVTIDDMKSNIRKIITDKGLKCL